MKLGIRSHSGSWLRNAARAICALLVMLALAPSAAHAVQYTDVPSPFLAIPENACPARVSRTITVTDNFVMGDVDVGVLLDHTYRADLDVTVAHTNTAGNTVTVQLMLSAGGSVDNLNVRFSDGQPAITTHTTVDSLTTAPYQRNFAPSGSLATLNGRNAQGTWTLSICDGAAQDIGSLRRWDLFIVPPQSDLSVTKTVSSATPANGTNVTYTIGVANAAGVPAATSVTVRDLLPAGTTFVSASTATGSYASSTGIWTVGNLAAGASASLSIVANVNASAGASITNWAEVWSSGTGDSDSTPGNNSTTEDDDASAVFTVSGARLAESPPNLVCPAGTTQRSFNWTAAGWTNGAASNTVAIPFVGNTVVSFAMPAGGVWMPDATAGQPSPNVTNGSSYGITPSPWVIRTAVDLAGPNDAITATYDFPTSVTGIQFMLHDVDYGANSWADRVRVTASYQGAPVAVTLSAGVANYRAGDTLYGDAGSANNSANGNASITIAGAFDKIIIEYGNHGNLGVIANPLEQHIAWGGFTKICDPKASVNATKISTVLSNPVDNTGGNLFAIPGAVVQYCISMTNAGPSAVAPVTTNDTLPANVTYIPGTLRSGPTCGSASTVEDDDNSDAGEPDLVTASMIAKQFNGIYSKLPGGSSTAFTFNVTVN